MRENSCFKCEPTLLFDVRAWQETPLLICKPPWCVMKRHFNAGARKLFSEACCWAFLHVIIIILIQVFYIAHLRVHKDTILKSWVLLSVFKVLMSVQSLVCLGREFLCPVILDYGLPIKCNCLIWDGVLEADLCWHSSLWIDIVSPAWVLFCPFLFTVTRHWSGASLNQDRLASLLLFWLSSSKWSGWMA